MAQSSRLPIIVAAMALLAALAAVTAASGEEPAAELGGEAVLFESATLGPVAQPAGVGWAVGVQTLLGWRFTVTEPVRVTNLGGHLVSRDETQPPQTIFVAIVPTVEGLPADTSLADDAVFSTSFAIDSPSAEITVPADVVLPPGTFGMIFGSGQLGADGLGNMPGNDTDVGSPGYFFCDVPSDSCLPGGLADARFFVAGVPQDEIFSDGFESGDTSGWSQTSP